MEVFLGLVIYFFPSDLFVHVTLMSDDQERHISYVTLVWASCKKDQMQKKKKKIPDQKQLKDAENYCSFLQAVFCYGWQALCQSNRRTYWGLYFLVWNINSEGMVPSWVHKNKLLCRFRGYAIVNLSLSWISLQK